MSDIGFSPGVARFDNLHSQSGRGGHHQSLRYPSPFFDIGHTYLPTSVKHMFRWCRYYFLTNPLINAVTYKMAEYPVTPIVFDDVDEDLRAHWIAIAEDKLNLRPFLVEVGLDYFCYGNAFITIHFPFEKYLLCDSCGNKEKIQYASYKFRNLKYHLACKACGTITIAEVEDFHVRSLNDINLIRWNPEHVSIDQNEITGETSYYLEVTTSLKNDILMGKRHVVETIPNEFVESIRKGKALSFTKENLFHLKRPTIAQKDQGWGMPLILPVLKDSYYLQILRKAQESIAHGYIVPLRILYPKAGSETSDPYTTSNLSLWKERIEAEIFKWRLDPNYIPILPLPIGNEMIGGEGKALSLHQEMRAWSEQIIAGMHVPAEFIYGGLQYSGSNVSMRMLENQFLGYRSNLLIMCKDFILARIARYMGWSKPKISFKPFKMADDLQKVAMAFQMNQAMKISDTTLLSEADYDIVTEEKHKKAELDKQLESQRKMQIAQANIAGDVMKVQAQYQKQIMSETQGEVMPGLMQQAAEATPGTRGAAEAQQTPGMPEGSTAYGENAGQANGAVPTGMESQINSTDAGGGTDILYLAGRAAAQLNKLDEQDKNQILAQMSGENPQLYQLVIQVLQEGKGSQKDPLDPVQSPLPKQRPPRRKKALV